VLYDKLERVHVHGHGSQEELKLLLSLVKPKFFVPIHGEYRHLTLHAQLAQSLGMPQSDTFVIEDGDILDLTPEGGRVAGRVNSGNVYVDGLGVGDIGTVVLRDRRLLSRDGIVVVIMAIDKRRGKVVGRPDIVSRGFIEMGETEDLLEQIRDLVVKTLDHGSDHPIEWSFINAKVKETLSRFLYQQTKRRPMILPLAVEV
jgi:ribonuclease J